MYAAPGRMDDGLFSDKEPFKMKLKITDEYIGVYAYSGPIGRIQNIAALVNH